MSILPSQTLNALNKQKGVPRALSIRSDINRSTAVVMESVSIPEPFKQLPAIECSDMVAEWTNDVGAGMGTASPEGSNVTLPSTASLHPPNRASSTTTPGKLHSPSPLYYDYTENFCNEYENYADPPAEETESLTSPSFLVERTIHEDRELSSDWSYLAMTDLKGRGFLASESLLMVPEENTENPRDQMADLSYTGGANLTTHNIVQQRPTGFSVDSVKNEISLTSTETSDMNKGSTESENGRSLYQTSGSASAMKQLSLNNHTPGRSFGDVSQEGRVLNHVDDSCSNRSTHDNLCGNPSVSLDLLDGLQSFTDSIVATSSLRGMAHKIQRSVPGNEYSNVTERVCPETSKLTVDLARQTPATHCLGEKCLLLSDQGSVSVEDNSVKPGQSFPMEHDLTGLAESVDKINSRPSNSIVVPSDKSTRIVEEPGVNIPRVNVSPLRGKRSHTEQATLPESRAKLMLNRYKSDGDLRLSGHVTMKQLIPNTDELLPIHGDEHKKLEVLFGSQSSRHLNLAPSSSIISPMPIYPGRGLRVKNSIPQLIDALPSLPLSKVVDDNLVSTVSRDPGLSAKTPPALVIEKDPLPIGIEAQTAASIPSTPKLISSTNSLTFQTPPFLSRFRLKSRSPAFREQSPSPNAAPSNSEQSQWDGGRSDIHSPPVFSDQRSAIFTPKLKLKLARTSVSSLGTVRINREAGGQTDVGNPDLLNPRDLFTSSPKLTTIFRQVSRHSHSKEPSTDQQVLARTVVDKSQNNMLPNSSEDQQPKSSLNMRSRDIASPTFRDRYPEENSASHSSISYEPFRGSNGRRTPVTSHKMPQDAETIPDNWQNMAELQDSSRNDISRLGVHHTRKRISSLKTLFRSPHARTTSRLSSDGIAWRPKVAAGPAPIGPSGPDIMVLKDGSDQILIKGSQRLKTKVASWLKAAKATMLSCVRPRKASGMVAKDVSGGTQHTRIRG